jgi:signal peptidase
MITGSTRAGLHRKALAGRHAGLTRTCARYAAPAAMAALLLALVLSRIPVSGSSPEVPGGGGMEPALDDGPPLVSRAAAPERRALRRAAAGLGALLLPVFASAILVALLLAVVLNRVPVLGYRAVILGGGSMEPALDSGSLLVSRAAGPEELRVGDVITFRHPGGSTTITHRIVTVREEGEQRWFTVKGDANRTADPDELSFESAKAYKYRFAIPYAGYLLGFIGSASGTLLLVVVPLAGLAAMHLRARKERARVWQT